MRGGIIGAIAVAFFIDVQPPARPAVPLVAGLTLVSALRFPDGDRENVVRVDELSADGTTFSWRFRERAANGDSVDADAQRFVRASDLASAPRYNGVFRLGQREDTPGYTAFVFSRATYSVVRERGVAPFAITWTERGPLDALNVGAPVNLTSPRETIRGTLTLVGPAPESMAVLVNGRAVQLPAIHLTGRFGTEGATRVQEFWLLADSANPLILKTVIGDAVLQMIRIDFPDGSATAAADRSLESNCRVDLPGVYFSFGSARLDPASNRALDGVTEIWRRHPDWTLTVEGHTDGVGDPTANQRLSVQRADAVRDALRKRNGSAAERLRSAGFGASRPRAPNATLEGRARNRRVELVRGCVGKP